MDEEDENSYDDSYDGDNVNWQYYDGGCDDTDDDSDPDDDPDRDLILCQGGAP